jgi:GH24 family phage-related lysozyme (muramidase)
MHLRVFVIGKVFWAFGWGETNKTVSRERKQERTVVEAERLEKEKETEKRATNQNSGDPQSSGDCSRH